METYEKKYKDALEKAMELRKGLDGYNANVAIIEQIFPELKESEDEKIRKRIYNYINVTLDDNESAEKEKWLAWLEKQGEQKPTPPVWKYKKDTTPLVRDSIILNKYGCVAKSPSGAIVSDVWVIDYDELAKLPKEEPEKPADKVESKFKVGDWVVNKRDEIARINQIKEDSYGTQRYYIEFTDGVKSDPMPCFADEEFRLWTIEDAKVGDVLASGQLVFIFKEILEGIKGICNEWIVCYCSTHKDGSFIADSYDLMTSKYFGEVYPATKEQRELLFTKMKEAGYEWSDKDRKLIKIVK